jgi:hypothetical protein
MSIVSKRWVIKAIVVYLNFYFIDIFLFSSVLCYHIAFL